MSEGLQAVSLVVGVIAAAGLVAYLVYRWSLDGWTVFAGVFVLSIARSSGSPWRA